MNLLTVKLKDCYGIGILNHDFKFDKANANLVYAPNGVMKTSFAKTFQMLSKGLSPEEKLYNKKSEHEVQLDTDTITSSEILVIEPFDKSFESKNISTLLVNPEKKQKYDAAIKEIIEAKQVLIKALRARSKLKLDDIEKQINQDFLCQNIFEALEAVRACEHGVAGYANISYSVIFDSKVTELLEDSDVKSGIIEYTKRYGELIEKSPLFSKGKFNPANAASVSKTLQKERFFDANHKVLLNGSDAPIATPKSLDDTMNKETSLILGDGHLREISKKIIGGVASIKTFQDLLEGHPQLAIDLVDLDKLRKTLWASYYLEDKELFDKLLNAYYSKKDDLIEIENQAALESTSWHETKDIFKARFHVPFEIDIEDNVNAILGTSAPNMVFAFEDEQGNSIAFNRGQLDSIDFLSVGERRAMYLMYVIFEIKARIQSGQRSLVIVDDIADSFDYKNKYAIIEYLKELSEEPLLRLIVLTHNFDFYRTFQSRILGERTKRECSFIAERSGNVVTLSPGGDTTISNPFEHWRNNFNSSNAILVSLIPFIRNLIEIKDGVSGTYHKLTSMLHIKPDTKTLTLADLEQAISDVIKMPLNANFNRNDLIIDLIYSVSDEISANQNPPSLSLENKISLSIAIRLRAEEFMWSHVSDKSEIKGSQTGKLYDRICKENKHLGGQFDNVRKILGQVILMTPENIHINSFMYEPLMDISSLHLTQLLSSIKNLSWPQSMTTA
ncbi:MAG: AAA family ATPase [Moraxellaceae bacterium]|nr:AAA family ATPase [Moraxellaceae bacterium]